MFYKEDGVVPASSLDIPPRQYNLKIFSLAYSFDNQKIEIDIFIWIRIIEEEELIDRIIVLWGNRKVEDYFEKHLGGCYREDLWERIIEELSIKVFGYPKDIQILGDLENYKESELYWEE